jgi:hypothetical protein
MNDGYAGYNEAEKYFHAGCYARVFYFVGYVEEDVICDDFYAPDADATDTVID